MLNRERVIDLRRFFISLNNKPVCLSTCAILEFGGSIACLNKCVRLHALDVQGEVGDCSIVCFNPTLATNRAHLRVTKKDS